MLYDVFMVKRIFSESFFDSEWERESASMFELIGC